MMGTANALPQRNCECGNRASGRGECEQCAARNGFLQRKAAPDVGKAETSSVIDEVLGSPGRALDAPVRAFMERRFATDFSAVRIHADSQADRSARAVNAIAYTVGPRIVFATGYHDTTSLMGQRVLAHELAHVVQQGDARASERSWRGVDATPSLEHEANGAARAVHDETASISVRSRTRASLMRLTPAEFRNQLGATDDQKKAIATLFADTTFLGLWSYLKNCPAKPARDLGPLSLAITPGLKIANVERYGGYSPMANQLEINPTKPEHKANPAELVDTVVHELIHAVDDLQESCKRSGAKDPPLKGAATVQSPPKLADVAGTPQETTLMTDLGPGASNPCAEFIDINKAAQQMIIQILKNNIRTAKVGRPTIVFVNEVLRSNPQAMADYRKCRDVACAKAERETQGKAIAACSADILARYTTPEVTEPKAGSPPPAGRRP